MVGWLWNDGKPELPAGRKKEMLLPIDERLCDDRADLAAINIMRDAQGGMVPQQVYEHDGAEQPEIRELEAKAADKLNRAILSLYKRA